MPDDLKITQPADPKKVNVNQDWEVKYWAEKFGITPQRLRDIVKKVGPEVEKIKKYLNR